MLRIVFLSITSVFLLSACGSAPTTKFGADGQPLPQVYKISAGKAGKVQFRMLDSVNSLRQASGVGPVQFDSKLNAAAATHSRDMSVQNRAWHFGSDGSSPIDRAARAGYTGTLLGENISETYETELETLSAWMEQFDTRAIILDPNAKDLGFSWYQQKDGKLWWTLLTGG